MYAVNTVTEYKITKTSFIGIEIDIIIGINIRIGISGCIQIFPLNGYLCDQLSSGIHTYINAANVHAYARARSYTRALIRMHIHKLTYTANHYLTHACNPHPTSSDSAAYYVTYTHKHFVAYARPPNVLYMFKYRLSLHTCTKRDQPVSHANKSFLKSCAPTQHIHWKSESFIWYREPGFIKGKVSFQIIVLP